MFRSMLTVVCLAGTLWWPLAGQVPLAGLTRLSGSQAKAQGRKLVLDGSIPIQDPAGHPVEPMALVCLLQGGKHTLDFYLDASGSLKVLVVREKTPEEQNLPASAPVRMETVPEPTAEELAAVDCTQVRAVLEELHDQDQGDRKAVVAQDQTLTASTILTSATRSIDPAREARNQRRLVAILRRCGWPSKAQVGEKGMAGAFLVLEHAPLPLQEQWLPAVQRAVAAGDLPAADGAILEDRIEMRRGRPQRYGSQCVLRAGRLWLWTIADPAGLEARRKAVGLPPLADQLKPLGLRYPQDVHPGAADPR